MDATLKAVGSRYPLVVMATPELPQDCRDVLQSADIPFVEVESIYPAADRHSLVENDHRFRDTWTKLRVFELVAFDVSRAWS
jgi:alpha-N-acetylglucosamine transferase